MTTTLTIDQAGRIVIPKALRDELHLTQGDSLKLESNRDEIVLKPIRETTPLQKENGFWVFRTGRAIENLSIVKWIDADREKRAQELGE